MAKSERCTEAYSGMPCHMQISAKLPIELPPAFGSTQSSSSALFLLQYQMASSF
jgi:hypothetical protein